MPYRPKKAAAANSGTEDGKKNNTDKAATTNSSEATNCSVNLRLHPTSRPPDRIAASTK